VYQLINAMVKPRFVWLLLAGLTAGFYAAAQRKDSSGIRVTGVDSVVAKNVPLDSSGKKKHDPRKATLRSAILPGWGQAYNRKYWKIPIVWGALGVTGYIFNFNRVQYNKVKFAYFALINKDTGKYSLITDPALKRFVEEGNSYALQSYRNEYRKDIDYSVLFFLFFWALNVVDATVDGHLKDFDISDDLSLKIKPSFYSLPTTPLGISFVFNIGKQPAKHSPLFVP
jgi:hypothetical protein